MDEKGANIATPRYPPKRTWRPTRGSISRAATSNARVALLPKQGPKAPWRQNQNYFTDIKEMRKAPIEDDALVFSKAKAGAKPVLARAAE